jgi:hypothetical protein
MLSNHHSNWMVNFAYDEDPQNNLNLPLIRLRLAIDKWSGIKKTLPVYTEEIETDQSTLTAQSVDQVRISGSIRVTVTVRVRVRVRVRGQR